MSTFVLCWMSEGWAQERPLTPVADRKDWLSRCNAAIPVSSALAGILAVDWSCSETFAWALRGGVAGFGYQKWLPFMVTELGFRYPSPLRKRAAQTSEPQGAVPADNGGHSWQLRGQLRYVFLQDSAFQGLTDLKLKGSLYSPSIQQWSLLTDADVSLEFASKCAHGTNGARACAIKLWQTLPPLWRSLGALRHTRNLEAYGLTLLIHFGAGAWTGSAGIGRATTLADRISASFFYPTVALSYALPSTSPSQQKSRDE